MTQQSDSVICSAGATPAVTAALEEIVDQFARSAIEIVGDGAGGAFVVIEGLDLGPVWAQADTWLGFHVTYLHPAADVYPHYVRRDLSRADGNPLGPGFAPTVWTYGNRPAIQISRRSNRWNPALDTPARKALKVLAWLVNQ